MVYIDPSMTTPTEITETVFSSDVTGITYTITIARLYHGCFWARRADVKWTAPNGRKRWESPAIDADGRVPWSINYVPPGDLPLVKDTIAALVSAQRASIGPIPTHRSDAVARGWSVRWPGERHCAYPVVETPEGSIALVND